MTLQEIKDAVDQDKIVYWCNKGYKVTRYGYNNGYSDYYSYYIEHHQGSTVSLTDRDGFVLNGDESEFFIGE